MDLGQLLLDAEKARVEVPIAPQTPWDPTHLTAWDPTHPWDPTPSHLMGGTQPSGVSRLYVRWQEAQGQEPAAYAQAAGGRGDFSQAQERDRHGVDRRRERHHAPREGSARQVPRHAQADRDRDGQRGLPPEPVQAHLPLPRVQVLRQAQLLLRGLAALQPLAAPVRTPHAGIEAASRSRRSRRTHAHADCAHAVRVTALCAVTARTRPRACSRRAGGWQTS